MDKISKNRFLNNITEKIVKNFNPEKIILFGSYAWGKPSTDSDLDLLIIMKSKLPPVKRIAEVSKILRPRIIPIDILVKTPKEIEKRLEIGDFFIKEILTKGKIIYERRAG